MMTSLGWCTFDEYPGFTRRDYPANDIDTPHCSSSSSSNRQEGHDEGEDNDVDNDDNDDVEVCTNDSLTCKRWPVGYRGDHTRG